MTKIKNKFIVAIQNESWVCESDMSYNDLTMYKILFGVVVQLTFH